MTPVPLERRCSHCRDFVPHMHICPVCGRRGGLVVGLTGRAGAGKDTLAHALPDTWMRGAFANFLKQTAANLFDLPRNMFDDPDLKTAPLVKLNDPLCPGEHLTPRKILQRIGTEVVRAVHPDAWANYLERHLMLDYTLHRGTRSWVITDVRFENEAAMVRRHGGLLVRVERPDLDLTYGGEHSSETEQDMISVDLVVVNDSTPMNLHRQAEKVVHAAERRRDSRHYVPASVRSHAG